MTDFRLLVGDRTGRIIAELGGLLESVPWRLNEIGKSVLHLADTEDGATAGNLRHGNRVYVEFDGDLPPWGGILDTPLDWENGIIKCSLYSGGQLWTAGWGETSKELVFNGQTAGHIFRRLIEEGNADGNLGIEAGSIYDGGPGLSLAFHAAPIIEAVKQIVERTGYEWELAPFIRDGHIRLRANLYERQGKARLGQGLVEGENVSVINYSQQGPIINRWTVYGADLTGEGDGWAAGRLQSDPAAGYDAASVARYGLRPSSLVLNDEKSQSALDATAAALLAASKAPKHIFSLRQTAGFASSGLGDTVRLLAHSVEFGGFDGTIRITSRAYDPASKSCELVGRGESDG